MKTIAENLLAFIRETNQPGLEEWYTTPPIVREFKDYVYNSGIWDGQFREKLERLQSMDAVDMTMDDLNAYFTAIVCIERTFSGFLFQNTYDGTLEKLLTRYLELAQ